jgi:hypothetical protein
VTEAQAQAAETEAQGAATDAPGPAGTATNGRATPRAPTVTLPEVGIGFALPGPSWQVDRRAASPTDSGPRVVALLATPLTVADVRIEWDPEGALAAPSPEEAQARLLQRLRTASSDLQVVEARQPLPRLRTGWRLGISGTLKQERVRTIAVVIDRGPARVVVLCACPEAAWAEARPALEAFVGSLTVL